MFDSDRLRRTTQNVDALLIVSDPSVKGVRTVARIIELVAELKLAVNQQAVVINLVPNSLEPTVGQELDRLGIRAGIPIRKFGNGSIFECRHIL